MPIQRESLSDKVANHLRMKILQGELPIGGHLSEPQLAAELAVSRGPIREAMRQLEHEGLTETPANGRTIVKGCGEQEVRDLFEVRFTLESLAIRSIIDRGFHRETGSLADIHRAMLRSETRADTIRSDIDFHHGLVLLSRNRALVNTWTQMRGLVSGLIEISTGIYEDPAFIAERHEELMGALEAGDGDEATRLLRQHLDTGERIIASFMRERQAPPAAAESPPPDQDQASR